MAQRSYSLNFDSNHEVGKVLDDLLDITGSVSTFQKILAAEENQYSYEFEVNFGPGDFKIDQLVEPVSFQTENSAQRTMGIYIPEDNFLFYKNAMQHGQHLKVEKLVKQIGELQDHLASIWQNEETLLGTIPALMLVHEKIDYLTLYTWFVKQIRLDDLDHEPVHAECIEPLIKKYGINWPMIDHLLAIGVRTQFGEDLLMSSYENPQMAEFLQNRKHLAEFKQRFRQEFKVSDAYDGEEVNERIDTFLDKLARK